MALLANVSFWTRPCTFVGTKHRYVTQKPLSFLGKGRDNSKPPSSPKH